MLGLKKEVRDYLFVLEFGEDRSPNTIRSIKSDLLQFCDFVEKKKNIETLSEITTAIINSFISVLIKEKISTRSVNRKISTLRSFFKHELKKGTIETNPALLIDFPDFSADEPDFLTLKEINGLRESIDTASVNGLRDRAMIELLYSSGITSQELLRLGEGAVNFEKREIKIHNLKLHRIVYFSERTAYYLQKYMEGKKSKYGSKYSEDRLFVNGSGTRLSSRSLRRILDRYSLKCDLKRDIHPHMFRHTFALHMLSNGMKLEYVQELLGHTTSVFTKEYLKILKKFQKQNKI